MQEARMTPWHELTKHLPVIGILTSVFTLIAALLFESVTSSLRRALATPITGMGFGSAASFAGLEDFWVVAATVLGCLIGVPIVEGLHLATSDKNRNAETILEFWDAWRKRKKEESDE